VLGQPGVRLLLVLSAVFVVVALVLFLAVAQHPTA
jgi:hypothetical protein